MGSNTLHNLWLGVGPRWFACALWDLSACLRPGRACLNLQHMSWSCSSCCNKKKWKVLESTTFHLILLFFLLMSVCPLFLPSRIFLPPFSWIPLRVQAEKSGKDPVEELFNGKRVFSRVVSWHFFLSQSCLTDSWLSSCAVCVTRNLSWNWDVVDGGRILLVYTHSSRICVSTNFVGIGLY